MKRTLVSISAAMAMLTLTLVPALAAAATSHHTFGQWDVTADDGGKAAPHYDAMNIGSGGAGSQDFKYGTRTVDWIYKTKFIEVGELVAGSNYIRWTRFDFASAGTTDRYLAQAGGITFTAHSAGVCPDQFKVVYEGSYTQLAGGVQTIRFTEEFYFYTGFCNGDPTDFYYYYGTAESLDTNDNFYWRIVNVQNPELGYPGGLVSFYDNYNSNSYGTWVKINENSLGPTPGGNANPDVKIEAYTTPVRRNYVSIGGANDVVATLNIAVDTVWFFDRRPEEILHDSTQNGESWSTLTDADGADIVIMLEFQSDVYYNTPDYTYLGWAAYDLENR